MKQLGRELAIILGTLLATTCAAQKPTIEEHAAAEVAALHDTMLDPASFVLDGVYVTKPRDIKLRKAGGFGKGPVIGTYVSICYVYRSHNAMGGYGEGHFVEDGGDYKAHPYLATVTDVSAKIPSYIGGFEGLGDPFPSVCKPSNIDREMTKDVATLAATLYQKAK